MKKILLIVFFIHFPVASQAFCFEEAGQRYGVSPWLLLAIAKAESSLNPSVEHHNRNGTIDVGLMQINSIWAEPLGKAWGSLNDPCTNVMAGAWILRQCMRDYGYTWKAVGCYHSRTPERRDAYALRIANILEQVRGNQ